MTRVILVIFALLFASGLAEPNRYAAGQVWEYRTRAGDAGSLLKIQHVENHPSFGGPVYHISVIGIRLRNSDLDPMLPHTPVSRKTLDASVSKLSQKKPIFPDHREGIAQWQADAGGVFDIPVAEIIEIIDQQTSRR